MDDQVTETNTSRPGSPVDSQHDQTTPRQPQQPVYRFTWDPSLRRPGPGSVSEATDNRYDAYNLPNAGSYRFSNLSSLSLAVPHEWSSSKHGFNAISTVLNNPHKKQAPPKAHSTLPALPPVELPRVRRKDFEPYLNAMSTEWERFENGIRLGREGAAQIEALPIISDPSHLTLNIQSPATPRTPRTPLPIFRNELPSLDVVPRIFFEPSFDLGDPQTFAAVTEASDLDLSSTLSLNVLAQPSPMDDKLANYADVVEQHLVREISLRSSSFFTALTNLHELQSESRACLDRTNKLRAMLKEVDERTAKRGLEMIRLENKLANIEKVNEGMRFMKKVFDMINLAGGLVQAGQWDEAISIIEELDSLWELPPSSAPKVSKVSTGTTDTQPLTIPEREKPAIPLSSLKAIAFLPSRLKELTVQITNSIASEFASVLKSDLSARIDQDQDSGKLDQNLRERLRYLLQCLYRTNGTNAALLGWRSIVLTEVRFLVKRHLPSAMDLLDEDEMGQSKTVLLEHNARLINDLRNMVHSDFIVLLRVIYKDLLRSVYGVQAQSQVIQSTFESLFTSPTTPFEAELADTLISACDLANTRVAKVMSARAEQHAELPFPDFHDLFELTWQFVVACEVLCRKMIVSLRGAAVSQAKAFLAAFHASRISASAKLVEDEQWSQVEVPSNLQRTVELLVDAAVHDPAMFILPKPELQLVTGSERSPNSPIATTTQQAARPPLSPPSTPPVTQPSSLANDNATGSNGAYLYIEERPYFVVGATLQVLVVILSDYIKLILNLPLLTTDTMGRVIEFLKAFNSRTCQVVLGAGAMRSAGLKNITAKHLALASQSLSIAIALIPYIRETFRRHLSATQAVILVEFDKLKRDYQEHQHEIHAKLVAIMGDRLNIHCRSLQEVRWEEVPVKAGPNGYMELLIKETVTLHKVLSKYLPVNAVEFVMTQVLAAINHRLVEEYTKIELTTQEAKQRMLGDVRYLQDRLSGLKHMGGQSGMLETIVEEKAIAGVAPHVSSKETTKSRLSAKMAAVVAGAGGVGLSAAKEDTVPQNNNRNNDTTTNSSNSSSNSMGVPESVPVPTSG